MPDILTVQEAMAKVMGDVREVQKLQRNTQQNFAFRGIDAVVNAVGPALRKFGVIVLPYLDEKEYLAFTSSKGTAMMCCRVTVRYVFVGPGGDRLEARVAGEAMDAGDKATAKAMSVAFRIALLQALALPTDDVDPDAQTYEMSSSDETVVSPSDSPSNLDDAGGGEPEGKLAGASTTPASESVLAGTDGSDPDVTTASLGGAAADTEGSEPTIVDPGEIATIPATQKNQEARLKGCQHQNLTAFRPDNETAYADGRLRCTDCGKTSRKDGTFA